MLEECEGWVGEGEEGEEAAGEAKGRPRPLWPGCLRRGKAVWEGRGEAARGDDSEEGRKGEETEKGEEV